MFVLFICTGWCRFPAVLGSEMFYLQTWSCLFFLYVQDGVDFLVFNLLVLRCLTDKPGHVCSIYMYRMV